MTEPAKERRVNLIGFWPKRCVARALKPNNLQSDRKRERERESERERTHTWAALKTKPISCVVVPGEAKKLAPISNSIKHGTARANQGTNDPNNPRLSPPAVH